jgi:ribosomal protein L31E
MNGYLAIDKNISNDMESENGYMEISVDNNINKNIWAGSKNKLNKKSIPNTKLDSNIRFKFKSETIENNMDSMSNSSSNSKSSEIEETEICFDNLI